MIWSRKSRACFGKMESEKDIIRIVEEIKSTQPTVDIEETKVEGPNYVEISLPYDCSVGAYFDTKNNVAEIVEILVPEELRQQGIAVKLLRTLALECKKRGITKIFGTIINKEALMARASAFGEESLRLPEGWDYETTLRKFDEDEDFLGTKAVTDLSKVDMDKW